MVSNIAIMHKYTKEGLQNKIIDVHSHIGVALKEYACVEFPYCQSAEGLYYKQSKNGVDFGVVFPFSADLFFNQDKFLSNQRVPSEQPLSKAPYQTENEMVLKEVFLFCSEYENRFLPFVSVDPGRLQAEQIENLLALEKQYNFYGIKINPLYCQSSVLSLLGRGKVFLDFARQRSLPFLIHSTSDEREQLSYAKNVFSVIEENQDLRFCLAHCLGFSSAFLEKANRMANVWVDTSALKIQSQMARENSPIVETPEKRFKSNYADHRQVMLDLARAFPETIIWGSDSPAYSYICQRKQGENAVAGFNLKGSYEEEKAGLDFLPDPLKYKVSNENTLNFLFGL